jgi:uncharacterized membrane protein YdjX (TVP38/TMEM64 family)
MAPPGIVRTKAPLVLLAAVVLLLLAGARNLDGAVLAAALEWIRGLGALGPVLFVGLYVGAAVLLVPGLPLTLGAGAIFGLATGIVTVGIAGPLAAGAAFLAGRYLARDWVADHIEGNAAFSAIDHAVAREGWKIVALTRLSPVFPFNVLNYAFGVTSISFRHYFFASWLGTVPGTLLYVYLGSVAGDLASLAVGQHARTPAEWMLSAVGLLATVAVTVYATRIARGALARRETA